MIQGAAFLFVLAYYNSEAVRQAVAFIKDLQTAGGVWFAAISSCISGAIIPELIKLKYRASDETAIKPADLIFRAVLMAMVGVLVYGFYLLQDALFGSELRITILLIKVLCDQLIFTPLLSLPLIVICFIAYENGFQPGAIFKAFNLATYRQRVLPLWATVLSYWPVMLLLIYAMPVEMQFILFLFANTAWCLLMIYIIDQKAVAA